MAGAFGLNAGRGFAPETGPEIGPQTGPQTGPETGPLPSRRAVLASVTASVLGTALLAGCGRLTVPDLPDTDVAPRPPQAPNRLRIAIFEIAGLDFPFHAGLIVHTPQSSIIFDPLGHWTSADCSREDDVFRDPTDAVVAAYLARDGLLSLNVGWTLHLFEIAVPASVAERAMRLALASPDYPPLHCAQAVSTVLAQLPGFEFVEPGVVTADLYRVLRAQPAFTYTRRALGG